MAKKMSLDESLVIKNIEATQKYLQQNNQDAFYVSSFDEYLNEYVPMLDCHRFYLTNFSGSVAEVLVPQKGKVKLFVDGRYYEQADLEVNSQFVEVVRVTANMGLQTCVLKEIETLGYKTLVYEAARTSVGFAKKLMSFCALTNFALDQIVAFEKLPALKPLTILPQSERGATTLEKLKRIITNAREAYFVSAIDSLSWLSNCLGYQLDFTSSFVGSGLATQDCLYVFIPDGVDLPDQVEGVIFYHNQQREMKLEELKTKYQFQKVYIDLNMLNHATYMALEKIFKKNLESKEHGIVWFHSLKDAKEMEIIEDNFKRGDRAIYKTIMWVKGKVKAGEKVSEYDLYQATTRFYQQEGAHSQSFNTIAGVDANGSIIHYGDPKDSVLIKPESLCLLDSGGYFRGGFATDTTRCFLGDENTVCNPLFKKIYTLTLKGTLQLQNAIFKVGCSGIALDALARAPMQRYGLDYNHGTGHGVGLNVHEGGVRISPVSNLPMRAGQVVSIEPGIYLPGVGGVRLENIALVIPHPEYAGFLKFKNLVYIGFESALIDEALLTFEEQVWLEEYERICSERGTSFRTK
jgi:Xaa-Pro aminopeptidase